MRERKWVWQATAITAASTRATNTATMHCSMAAPGSEEIKSLRMIVAKPTMLQVHKAIHDPL